MKDPLIRPYDGVILHTEEQIRAEVRRCIDECAADGGYPVYGASVNMYTPQAYMSGGTLHIALDESGKYGHLYYQ